MTDGAHSKKAAPPKGLKAPPAGAPYGKLLEALRDAGARPLMLADRAGQKNDRGASANPGDTWLNKSLGALINRTEKTIQRFCAGESLPNPEQHAILTKVLFGSDEADYIEWRIALQSAWEFARKAKEAARREADASTADTNSDVATGNHQPAIIPVRVPIHFHGRDANLSELRALMLAPPHRVTVHGIHGVGKTMLAAAYARSFGASYQKVVWIDATTASGCTLGLTRILSLPESSAGLQEVLARLTAAGEGTLLIYDDATGAKALAPFLPGGSSAHILITSNSPNWRSEAKPYCLQGLTEAAGADFLQSRLGQTSERDEAEALASELGGLPLALELAAAYCEYHAMAFAKYRMLFASEPFHHLSLEDHLPPGYSQSLAKAYTMSLASACVRNPNASALLEFASFLSPRGVPLCVLDEAFPLIAMVDERSIEAQVDAAIAALRDHSLLSLFKYTQFDTRDNGGEKVMMHRLVEHLTRDRISDTNVMLRLATDALGRAYFLSEEASRRHVHLHRHVRDLMALSAGALNTPPPVSMFAVAASHSDGAEAVLNFADSLLKKDSIRSLTLFVRALELAQCLDIPERDAVVLACSKDVNFLMGHYGYKMIDESLYLSHDLRKLYPRYFEDNE